MPESDRPRKGFTVRKKFALLASLATLALSLVGAQTASASYLSVHVTPTFTAVCQPVPGQVGMVIAFKANVVAIGISKPKKIRIGYQVLPKGSKTVYRSGVVNLKRSKGYKAYSKTWVAYDDQALVYHLNMSYTVGGKKYKKKRTFHSTTYTQDELNALGVPACS